MDEDLIELYDRFSFDKFFRLLLSEGYDNEDALNFILSCGKLSALVYQERIENEFYKNITVDDTISSDLQELMDEYRERFLLDRIIYLLNKN